MKLKRSSTLTPQLQPCKLLNLQYLMNQTSLLQLIPALSYLSHCILSNISNCFSCIQHASICPSSAPSWPQRRRLQLQVAELGPPSPYNASSTRKILVIEMFFSVIKSSLGCKGNVRARLISQRLRMRLPRSLLDVWLRLKDSHFC
jgi:hypothetical protein